MTTRPAKLRPWSSILLSILLINPLPSSAFKIGTDPYSTGHSHGIKIDLFGDPVHEDMVWESISLAKESASSMSCQTSAAAIAKYLDLDNSKSRQKLSHRLCCHEGAKSRVCDLLEINGKWPEFEANVAPIITGVRWNDDVCHMSYADRARHLWGTHWLNGLGVKRFNNSSFSSHFHEQQFLHSMAPSSVYDPSSYRIPTEATRQRIDIWAKLAFEVAEGKIPAGSTLKQAFDQIDSRATQAFDSSFNHQDRTLSFIFTGMNKADNDYVRQMALGSLLHMVQDSFSSSHVEREFDDWSGLQPIVKSKGKIKKFHTYGIQSPSRHGVADHRPADLSGAKPGDFHPVSLGAELLACAVAGNGIHASKWPEAEAIINRIFEKSESVGNCAANAGRAYVAQGQSDVPDAFLIEGTVEPIHCRW